MSRKERTKTGKLLCSFSLVKVTEVARNNTVTTEAKKNDTFYKIFIV